MEKHLEEGYMKKSLILGLFAAVGITAGTAGAATLDDVKARGNLNCGVSTGAPGFATVDDSGKNVGFDVDYCRALAAAIFGDPMAVKFVPLTSAVRSTPLNAFGAGVNSVKSANIITIQRSTGIFRKPSI